MRIRAKLGREALNEGDGSALASPPAPLGFRAPAKRGEESTEKGAEDFACEARVVGASRRTEGSQAQASFAGSR